MAAMAPDAAASAPSRVRRPPPDWRLEIKAPDDIRQLLSSYLDLARYRVEAQSAANAPANSASEAATLPLMTTTTISRSELRRLVAAMPDQARDLIEAQGYFAATITTSVGDEVEGQPLVITLVVDPGPKTRVTQVQLMFEGTLDVKADAGDKAALALETQLAEQWTLPVGSDFRQDEWAAAKNALLARLRAQGYPMASWSGAAATVDAQAHTAKLFVVADSGPAFRFSHVDIEGLKYHSASTILNVSPFTTGELVTEKELLDFQERIQKLDLFDNVFVTLTPDESQADAAVVSVQVREMLLQQATLGVGISSDTGPRVSAEHVHRHVFGTDWQSKLKLQLGQDDSSFESTFTSAPLKGRRRWTSALQLARELQSDDSVKTSEGARFGQLQEGDRLERTHYVEYIHAKVDNSSGDHVSDASAVDATTQWTWRDVDNQLLPTKGIALTTTLALGQSFARIGGSGGFGRAYGKVVWYQPLPLGWYATTRAEVGQVLARGSVSVPDTLLFNAGGDNSVRGYDYNSLGIEKDGATVGGRAMATGSIELAHVLSSRMPSLLGAAFVDTGAVSDHLSDLSFVKGLGVGLRWRSPVGPLRFDIARGVDANQWRVHFSVGIAL